jgi:hypothetical protein
MGVVITVHGAVASVFIPESPRWLLAQGWIFGNKIGDFKQVYLNFLYVGMVSDGERGFMRLNLIS